MIYFKTESPVDDKALAKILKYLHKDNFRSILPSICGKTSIFRSETWSKLTLLSQQNDSHVIVLADLDNFPCVTEQLKDLARKKLIIPVLSFSLFFAVREIEFWLMSDKTGFSEYFGVDTSIISKIIRKGEYSLLDPKSSMRTCVRNHGSTYFKRIISSSSPQDAERYFLEFQSQYIENIWNIENAMKGSKSLQRMINILSVLPD